MVAPRETVQTLVDLDVYIIRITLFHLGVARHNGVALE